MAGPRRIALLDLGECLRLSVRCHLSVSAVSEQAAVPGRSRACERLRAPWAAVPVLAAGLLVLGAGLVGQARGQAPETKPLTAAEAKDHLGSQATVCGKVMSPRFATATRGQPTFLNLDKAYPDQDFTVVIWGADRAKFGQPEVTYRDKTICVTGKIQPYQGKAEIVVTDPKQIELGK